VLIVRRFGFLNRASGTRAHYSWRTEPSIGKRRRQFLLSRLAIVADDKRGVYPFGDIALDRADVEWLLGALDNGLGPVNLRDPAQANRAGLDLRGADLSGQNLSHLPLAHLNAGSYTLNSRATVKLRKSNLSETYLTGADLSKADLVGANLESAQLDDAYLLFADLQKANLSGAHMRGAFLLGANLGGANLEGTHLEGACLFQADLGGGDPQAGGSLLPADLTYVFLDSETDLSEATIANSHGVGIGLVHARWNGFNVSRMDWRSIRLLLEEVEARRLQRQSASWFRVTTFRLLGMLPGRDVELAF
jgi:uncharacterized protein YjbI with pentapeptide repeats